ncbi:MAG: hypothetical protein WKF92_13920 [Pyrinomonadaceae bacterium]
MKQCPACKTTYTDETLRFCLADGTALTAFRGEEPTVVRPSGNGPNRYDLPDNKTVDVKGAGSTIFKIVIAVVILGFLALLAAGLAGAFFYYKTGDQNTARQTATPSPNVTPKTSPTPDDEKTRLRDELANLQTTIDEQKRTATNTSPFPTPGSGTPTARLNSPRDGFLALRSEPDAEYGERLAKIPHGTVIELNNCEKEKVTIGSKTGRWCLVTYGDHAGYVFDAWLIY